MRPTLTRADEPKVDIVLLGANEHHSLIVRGEVQKRGSAVVNCTNGAAYLARPVDPHELSSSRDASAIGQDALRRHREGTMVTTKTDSLGHGYRLACHGRTYSVEWVRDEQSVPAGARRRTVVVRDEQQISGWRVRGPGGGGHDASRRARRARPHINAVRFRQARRDDEEKAAAVRQELRPVMARLSRRKMGGSCDGPPRCRDTQQRGWARRRGHD